MKVLMFCPQFAPLIGGAERQAERLGRALLSHGVDVEVWTPLLDANSPCEELRDGLRIHRFALSDLAKRWPWFRGIGLINAPWIALQLAWRLWGHIATADIVHCHIGSLQSIAVGWAARLHGVPVICKAAMADSHSDLGEMARAGLTGKLAARLGRNLFTRWVATTHAVRDALLRAGVSAHRIVVIPNGIEVPEDGKGWVSCPVRRFLYLGRLSSNIQRDTPSLIQAFENVAERFPDAELALVGDGDLLEPTRVLARQCAHADRIQVPGFGDAKEWLSWADCFVLPSRREGLSNALLEAMGHGLPCIANDIPPNREVLADGACGLLVPVGDVPAMAAAMMCIAADFHMASEVAILARDRASQTYAFDSVCGPYKNLYQALHA